MTLPSATDLWLCGSIASWLVALWLVFTLEKFETKWKWLLLSCVFVTLRGMTPDGRDIGLPVGTALILLAALYGPSQRQTPRRPALVLDRRDDEAERGAGDTQPPPLKPPNGS